MDLLATAQYLVDRRGRRPRQADLKRASSTIYYAMFHELAGCCADCLVGSKSADRADRAWLQVYRTLDHGHAAQKCSQIDAANGFPEAVEDFSDHFVSMKKKREDADYDPTYSVTKLDVINDLNKTKIVISAFNSVAYKHRRAFAAFVILKSKQRG